jgi:hypothetical protein
MFEFEGSHRVTHRAIIVVEGGAHSLPEVEGSNVWFDKYGGNYLGSLLPKLLF